MPLLAEIVDKMPTLATLWEVCVLIGLVVAAVTFLLSFIKQRFGGVVVVLAAGLGALSAWPDHIMDPEIIQELGVGYLFQQRISGFVPFGLALSVWGIVPRIRWHSQAGPGNVPIKSRLQMGGTERSLPDEQRSAEL